MKNPLISVVVLNYNGKEMTTDCIRSVLKSAYNPFEIVVIDNGSTDNSVPHLKKLFGKNNKVRILSTGENLFFTGGFNYGAVHSEGKWVVFLSNDTVVERSWLTELLKATKENDKSIVQPKIKRFSNKKIIDNVGGTYNIWGIGTGRGYGETDKGQYDNTTDLEYTSATTFMMSRAFFLQLGGFDTWFYSHYEDCDLSFRAKKAGGSCVLAPKSIIYHRGSVTYKKYVDSPTLLYHIRKNRLAVVLRNFKGTAFLIRFLLLMMENAVFTLQDLTTLKRERLFVTIKSVSAALKKGRKIHAVNLEKVYS